MESRYLRVFLCHATQDKPKVHELYNRLQSEDWIEPWLDTDKLLPGQDWDLEIYKAIRVADLIIVCFSKNSTTKEGYVQKEIKRALNLAEEKPEGTIYIVPLRLDNSELPIRFKQYQWLDYFTENGHEKLLQSLRSRAGELNLSVSKSAAVNHSHALMSNGAATNKAKSSIYDSVSGKEYPKDLWDYLVDMPHMPSRVDRDRLIEYGDEKRVKLWDYFFRINSEDVGIPQQQELSSIRKAVKENAKQFDESEIAIMVKRVMQLELDLEMLRRQIPVPPPYETVRQWLDDDLGSLWERSKDVSGLSNRLIEIEDTQNPIPLIGPAELQRPERFPPTFSDVNLDLRKHLVARQAVQLSDGRIDILYAVYYLEYILIADDVVATYELFYDFVSGKLHATEATEQYYTDIVAIGMKNEFRRIIGDESGTRSAYVEDAPTFTLSLANGEHHSITFANERYFLEIKDRINITEENIARIYFIRDSQVYADHAIKALRHHLRLHKSLGDNGE